MPQRKSLENKVFKLVKPKNKPNLVRVFSQDGEQTAQDQT